MNLPIILLLLYNTVDTFTVLYVLSTLTAYFLLPRLLGRMLLSHLRRFSDFGAPIFPHLTPAFLRLAIVVASSYHISNSLYN